MFYLLLYQHPGVESKDKLAGIKQPEEALPVGTVPGLKGSRLKRSPEVEPVERDMGVLKAESNALTVAGSDMAHLCRANMPREAAPACLIAEASREDLNMYYISSSKLDALPRAEHPRKTGKAQITPAAPGIEAGISLSVAADGPSGPDLTLFSSTCNNPHKSIDVSWGWGRAAQWPWPESAKGRTQHRTPSTTHPDGASADLEPPSRELAEP